MVVKKRGKLIKLAAVNKRIKYPSLSRGNFKLFVICVFYISQDESHGRERNVDKTLYIEKQALKKKNYSILYSRSTLYSSNGILRRFNSFLKPRACAGSAWRAVAINESKRISASRRETPAGESSCVVAKGRMLVLALRDDIDCLLELNTGVCRVLDCVKALRHVCFNVRHGDSILHSFLLYLSMQCSQAI